MAQVVYWIQDMGKRGEGQHLPLVSVAVAKTEGLIVRGRGKWVLGGKT